MCGICGVAASTHATIDPALIQRMKAQLVHRGPDDEGDFFSPGIGFGFRRLAILDLTPAGHQPMMSPDQSLTIIFNGEVYNFQELRDDLQSRGHVFKSRSDTEVILHGFQVEGAAFFGRLAGMFALAIWDSRHRQLHLARDRFGKKPLFYSINQGKLFFASELQALRAVVPKPELDSVALQQYFRCQFIPHPRTIYRGIKQLPPAHRAVWENGQLQIHRYWGLSFKKTTLDLESAGQELERWLRTAVQQRMVSDVPLGVFLSGGLDSSIITALMAESSEQPVKTFSIGFQEESHNELPLARLVAQKYGTDHHEYILQPNVHDVLPKLLRHYGQPFADSSAIAVAAVAEQTRREVTVALNGDGGDENFAGYDKYALLGSLANWDVIPAPLRRWLQIIAQPIIRTLPAAQRHRLLVASQFFGEMLPERYLDSQFVFSAPELAQLLPASTSRKDRAEQLLIGLLAQLPASASLIDQLTALDLQFYLPDALMTKADIATMAHSLEGRSPFLDHRLVEFTASLPDQYKIQGGQRKYLLRRQFSHLLPPQLLTAKKRGFDLPVNQWLKTALLPTLKLRLSDPSFRQLPFFNHHYVQQLIHEHETGQRPHAIRLWSLLCFAIWHQDTYQ